MPNSFERMLFLAGLKTRWVLLTVQDQFEAVRANGASVLALNGAMMEPL